MKKKIVVLFAAMMLSAALILAGCENEDTDKTVKDTSDAATQVTEDVTEATTAAVTDQTEAPVTNDTNASVKLTEEEALDIALKDAGVSKEDVIFSKAELDSENGKVIYEVEFDAGDHEYNYDIDANTGEIYNSESELAD